MEAMALNLTITQNQEIMKRLATKFTHDPYEIEELVQETFIRSLSSLEKFIDHPKLIAWLYVIMRNVYINKYRRANKYKDVEKELTYVPHFEKVTTNQCETNFAVRDIRNAIKRLPRDNYKSFSMYLEGYKYHEIANILRIAEGTVKTRIHVARKLLKQQLTPYVHAY